MKKSKLQLNRTTLRSLQEKQLGKVDGGALTRNSMMTNCASCNPDCSNSCNSCPNQCGFTIMPCVG